LSFVLPSRRRYSLLSYPAKAGYPVHSASRLKRAALGTGSPAGACHRARRRRDPVPGDDAL